MIDRRRIISRVCSRLRKEHGFIGKAGMLHRRAQDEFFLLVYMRQFMAPMAGDYLGALLAPDGRTPAIEIRVGLHAPEMYLADRLTVPRVEDLRSTPFLPGIHVVGPSVDGNVTGGFLATESFDEDDMFRRVVAAVEEADAAMGSRDRVIATWKRDGHLPGKHPDWSAKYVAFVVGLNGDLPGGEAILTDWMPRLTERYRVEAFEDALVRLRGHAGRGAK